MACPIVFCITLVTIGDFMASIIEGTTQADIDFVYSAMAAGSLFGRVLCSAALLALGGNSKSGPSLLITIIFVMTTLTMITLWGLANLCVLRRCGDLCGVLWDVFWCANVITSSILRDWTIRGIT